MTEDKRVAGLSAAGFDPAALDKPNRGRPTRAQASAAAMEALRAAGFDPASVDPRAVLAAVAGDPSAPASARVAAARTLLADATEREIRAKNDRALRGR